MQTNHPPFAPTVRIVASRRRRRTVSARLRSGVLELLVPDWMPHVERERWAEVMRGRIQRRLDRARPSDERLAKRAGTLNERHFGGRLRWTSIGFADMTHLWGSCTFTSGAIRIATRAQSLPEWVIDYLVIHELAHLEHSNHGPAFHEMENRYPLTERARGYLMAIDQGAAKGGTN
jgi:predicted metal-dependent hydrolase